MPPVVQVMRASLSTRVQVPWDAPIDFLGASVGVESDENGAVAVATSIAEEVSRPGRVAVASGHRSRCGDVGGGDFFLVAVFVTMTRGLEVEARYLGDG